MIKMMRQSMLTFLTNLTLLTLSNSFSMNIDGNSNQNINLPYAVSELPPVPSTSKRLFLVRHGEVINPGGDRPVYYGALDVPLSPLGEMEAAAAGSYLKQFDMQHVASSPLSRAIFGAKQVKKLQTSLSNDAELVVYEGLKELDRGVWCGKTKGEIGVDLMDRFDECDEGVTPRNGESYSTVKKRVLEARDKLLSITDLGKASTIVSHLQVTRCMLSEALGIPNNEMSTLKVATASITCIDYCGESGKQVVQFASFKPDAGLEKSKDMAN